jgi:hypothetical protein
MRRAARRACGVAVLLAFAAGTPGGARADGLAEPPRPRQGYSVAAGGHGALSYHREDGEGLGPWGGFTASLRLGQLVTRRIGIGLAIDGGGASGDGQSATLAGLGLAGQIVLAGDLALHASVGLGVVSLSSPGDDELRGAVGAAYTLGLTYDWFPGRRRSGGFAVTPGLSVRALPSDDVDAFGAFVGVEMSYWTGLRRHQLELPDAEAFGDTRAGRPRPPPAQPETPRRSAEPAASPDAMELAKWGRNRPLELSSLRTRPLYVVAERASICPTTGGAERDECGHTVEEPENGYVVRRGDRVLVAGDAPVGGLWRAVRFMKHGPLPGWILAARLAAEPDLSVLAPIERAVEADPGVDGATLTFHDVAALSRGTRVTWKRLTGAAVRFGAASHTHSTLFIELPADASSAGGGLFALDVSGLVNGRGEPVMEKHSCMVEGDCLGLTYTCDDAFCDAIAIEAVATGFAIGPPEDPEREWPAGAPTRIPLLRALRLADRYGLFQ